MSRDGKVIAVDFGYSDAAFERDLLAIVPKLAASRGYDTKRSEDVVRVIMSTVKAMRTLTLTLEVPPDLSPEALVRRTAHLVGDELFRKHVKLWTHTVVLELAFPR
jgi:hypothetical protein